MRLAQETTVKQGKGRNIQQVGDAGKLLQRYAAVSALKAALVQGGQAEALSELLLREAFGLARVADVAADDFIGNVHGYYLLVFLNPFWIVYKQTD